VTLELRRATGDDAAIVAALHADSWRRHYRGAYSDAYLDGDIESERLAVWTARFADPDAHTYTVIVELDGAPVGFAHTVFDSDDRWGSLVDNLHVSSTAQRRGLGAQLMGASAQAVLREAASPGLFLWVLEMNTRAQAFYDARGGTRVDSKTSTSPAGDALTADRYVWKDPTPLVQ
jgi:ribosomal protein S18 acetylase RimI-like enzyme